MLVVSKDFSLEVNAEKTKYMLMFCNECRTKS